MWRYQRKKTPLRHHASLFIEKYCSRLRRLLRFRSVRFMSLLGPLCLLGLLGLLCLFCPSGNDQYRLRVERHRCRHSRIPVA